MIKLSFRNKRGYSMSKKWSQIIFIGITALLILSCGTLNISVVNNPPTPVPTMPVPASSPVVVTIPPTPAPTLTSTQPVPTATVAAAATTAAVTRTPGVLTNQPVRILSTHMLDASLGWAVGQVNSDLNDHLMFTGDGGTTWHERSPLDAFLSAPASGLAATAFFASASQAWAAYTGRPGETVPSELTVWHTTDGGENWQPGGALDLSGLNAEYAIPSDLGFLTDNLHGWMMVHLGSGMNHDYIAVFTTDNSGKTWNRVVDSTLTGNITGGDQAWDLMSCPKTGLAFSDPTTAWLSGNCPGLITNLFLYRSGDAGKTWTQVNLVPPDGQPSDLFSSGSQGCGVFTLAYTSPRSVYIAVNCANYTANTHAAWLYASHDGGQSFFARPLPAPYGNFYFIDLNWGWLLGTVRDDPTLPANLYVTSDGGRTWVPVTPTNWQGVPDFVDANTGWVAATHADVAALVFSKNGGKTWGALAPMLVK
jgi:photosystem II stability/assembly factor-like uncharacterized protein